MLSLIALELFKFTKKLIEYSFKFVNRQIIKIYKFL